MDKINALIDAIRDLTREMARHAPPRTAPSTAYIATIPAADVRAPAEKFAGIVANAGTIAHSRIRRVLRWMSTPVFRAAAASAVETGAVLMTKTVSGGRPLTTYTSPDPRPGRE
jgi:hypothetical protein